MMFCSACSAISEQNVLLEDRLQRLQDAHRCSVCYAAPRNALVSLCSQFLSRPTMGWLPLKPLSACLCHAVAFTSAKPTTHIKIFWCWVDINPAPQRSVRLKTKLCSQVLPCMHMDVCFECIQKHEQQQRLRDPTGSVTCPMCRAPIRSTMPLPVQSPDVM